MPFVAAPHRHSRLRLFLACCILAFYLLPIAPAAGYALDVDTVEDFDLSTPYQTMWSHYHFLRKDNFRPEVAAHTLNIPNPNSEYAQELAIELMEVYDGQFLILEFDKVPDKAHYTDTANGKQRYVPFRKYPRIFLERVDNRWLYARKTVEALPSLHRETYPLGMHRLMKLTRGQSQSTFLGLTLTQYLALLIMLLLCLLLHKLLTFVFTRIIFRVLERFSQRTVARDFIEQVARPTSVLVVLLFIAAFLPALRLPVLVAQYTDIVLLVLNSIFGIAIFYRLVDLLSAYFEKLAAKTENTLDDQMVPIVRKTLKVLVVVGGVAFVLQNVGVEVTALLAGISIGGLAFALAAQDTVKNFFGSVMIFVDRPFQVGDWIVFDSTEGTVEEVGIRSTRIRTFYNSVVYVPNAKLADATVDNMGMRIYRRFSTTIAITYDTPPDLIEAYIEGLREVVRLHPDTRKDYFQIHLKEMGAHSLNIMLYIFFEVPDWTKELEGKHEVMMAAIRMAHELGIRFAFPTKTIHVETFPDKSSLTPEYQQNRADWEKQVSLFLAQLRTNQAANGGRLPEGGMNEAK